MGHHPHHRLLPLQVIYFPNISLLYRVLILFTYIVLLHLLVTYLFYS